MNFDISALNYSYNSSSNTSIEQAFSWIQNTLQPSTSDIRSSVTAQIIQRSLFVFCLIIVPWAAFLSTFYKKKSMMTTVNTDKNTMESGDVVVDQNSVADKEGLPTVQEKTQEKSNDDGKEDDDVMDSDMAPLHFNILRSPARLRGLGRPNSRSSSFSRSRSTSPVPTQTPQGSSARDVLGESGSEKVVGVMGLHGISRSPSDHSLESSSALSQCSVTDKYGHQHIITEDMLTDRLGFVEVVPPNHSSPHVSANTLPSVCERMSEESLDDCHAFSDVKVSRRMSWGSDRPSTSGGSVQGSVGGGDGSCNNSVLKTLEEEGDSSSDDENENDKEVVATGAAAESVDNPNIEAADSSPFRSKEEETKIMFEMLDLVSTDEERRILLEKQKLAALAKQKKATS